jgi:CheY-like chemotaxis protein
MRLACIAAMCTILLISSDAQTRRWWSDALARHGCNAVVLAPGVDALLTATTPLDAIVVDIQLAFDWQHFRVLGQEKPQLTAPLIVMRSWRAPDGRYRRKAFAIGCDAFLEQPCSVEAVLAVVDRLAAGERDIEVTAIASNSV